MKNTQHIFEREGAKFLLPEEALKRKLNSVKAFVFDWDGVFNNGQKEANGSSVFNEVDSMGTNLLRFSYFLAHGHLPYTVVISGEKNKASFFFCKREHFTSNYFKIAHKITAIEHFCSAYNLKPENIAYVFDDVLDLSIAQICGIRCFIPRKANPLFNQYVTEQQLADYMTAHEGGNFAVREITEMLMGIYGNYTTAITERMNYSAVYSQYIQQRNAGLTSFFTRNEQGQLQAFEYQEETR